MTTPEEAAVSGAIRDGDVRWLSAYFAQSSPSLGVLRSLLRDEDPHVRHLGLALLVERAAARPDAESAALLPAGLRSAAPAEAAETALVLARAYELLRAFVRPRAWPRWREADLPARVRVAWLRAEIVHRPGAVLWAEAVGEELYQAVEGIGAGDVDDVDAYVRALTGRADPVLGAAALRVVREGLHGALLDPDRARSHLLALLDRGGSRTVVTGALRELAQPWAAVTDSPGNVLAGLMPGEPAAVLDVAVLDVAVRHGGSAVLRGIAADPGSAGGLRQRGLAAIGEFATREEIGGVLSVAGTDPLLLAGAAVEGLGALHRRGHFVAVSDAPAVVELALADHAVPARDVAVVLFTVREAAVRALVAAPTEDPGWPRRIELLVALAEQGAAELPIGAALAARLPLAVRPEPFLDGLRELRHRDAEQAVLAELPRAPEAVLRAVEAIGGPATVTALRAALGLTEPGGVIAPYLRGVPHLALEILWQLTEDPEQRRELLDRLDARDLPKRIAADLGAPDARELAVLASHPDPDDPVEALCRLARNGDASTLPTVADLLLRVVGGLVAARGEEIAEPVVPDEVVTAIGDLGERLYRRGALRPVCLLDAGSAAAARDVLVASIALDLTDRPDLTDAELAVVLALLVDIAPYRRTRARTHRLLRHRDPHVRKHVIALLARDAGREDARALSASLIPLTAVDDPRTVRQALLALGHARARWAGEAVGKCLDHPVMNVKKTAADVLVHTGTPAQVPALLKWLGRYDNPGLRSSLIAALRAILGDAYAAVVLSAAERAPDERSAGLLLSALDKALSARAIGALADRESPVARRVLTLVAQGWFGLAGGTAGELSRRFTAYGIEVPDGRDPVGPDDAQIRADLVTLAQSPTHVGDPAAVLRLARRHEHDASLDGEDSQDSEDSRHSHNSRRDHTGPVDPAALRHFLPGLLAVAREHPDDRSAVLRLALHACPAPHSAEEQAAFADAAGTPAAESGTVAGLAEVLAAVVDRLAPAVAFALATRIRALPTQTPATWSLLRRCGAVLTRADLVRALAGAHAEADPWTAEVALLRDAFGVGSDPEVDPGVDPGAEPVDASRRREAAAGLRTRLDGVVRTPGAVETLPALDDADATTSRDRLAALIDAYPAAHPDNRAALLDRLVALQPIDAPAWTHAEQAARPDPPARTPHAHDLDQPHSAARRERLLSLLATAPEPARRTAAAHTLLARPEPDTRRAVLDAYLRGGVALPESATLAHVLTTVTDLHTHDDAAHERAARLAAALPARDRDALAPQLVAWWATGGPATRAAAHATLRLVPVDVRAEAVRDRLAERSWGFLDLVTGPPLLRTPELDRVVRRLRADGRTDLADRLVFTDGPLRGPDAVARDTDALELLRTRHEFAAAPAPSRDDLIATARTGGPEQVRRALSRLADDHGRDRAVRTLVVDLLTHPVPRVRTHAHRISRRLFERPEYLGHTELLLTDARADIVRSAVRTLSHAAWTPAVPAFVALLAHADPTVRAAAADGLARIGPPAVPPLRHAAAHARPDRRSRYTELLDRIDAGPR